MSVAGQHQGGGQAAQAAAEDDRVGHYPTTTSLRPFYSGNSIMNGLPWGTSL